MNRLPSILSSASHRLFPAAFGASGLFLLRDFRGSIVFIGPARALATVADDVLLDKSSRGDQLPMKYLNLIPSGWLIHWMLSWGVPATEKTAAISVILAAVTRLATHGYAHFPIHTDCSVVRHTRECTGRKAVSLNSGIIQRFLTSRAHIRG